MQTSRWVRGALAAALVAGSAAATAAPVLTQGTWTTTLQARDIAGNPVPLNAASAAFFYDTTLNVTWLRDFNAGAGSAFDTEDGFNDGRMTWARATAWAAALNVGGFDDWRLPVVIDSGDSGCNWSFAGGTDCGYNVQTEVGGAYSEWAHLYHVTLGNLAYRDTSGTVRSGLARVDWGLVNTAHFQNMRSDYYWSGTAYAPSPATGAWYFGTRDGVQSAGFHFNHLFAVAVRPGDVFAGAVPEPSTVALLLAALGALALTRGRRTP